MVLHRAPSMLWGYHRDKLASNHGDTWRNILILKKYVHIKWLPANRDSQINPCLGISSVIHLNILLYRSLFLYLWSRVPCSYPPQWYASPGSTPVPSICSISRSLQHFWLPASHLLGTCYFLDDLRSTHTSSKYLRTTYGHIYMCYVSTSCV